MPATSPFIAVHMINIFRTDARRIVHRYLFCSVSVRRGGPVTALAAAVELQCLIADGCFAAIFSSVLQLARIVPGRSPYIFCLLGRIQSNSNSRGTSITPDACHPDWSGHRLSIARATTRFALLGSQFCSSFPATQPGRLMFSAPRTSSGWVLFGAQRSVIPL